MAELDFYIHVKSNADGTAAECNMIPSVDVNPVLYGEWKDTESYNRKECSVCGDEYSMPFDFKANVYLYNYCPSCGANMRWR